MISRISAAIAGLSRRFRKDRRGASAIEYAIIAAGISVVIVIAVTALGTTLRTDFFEPTAEALSNNN